jgi:hypothetical protein
MQKWEYKTASRTRKFELAAYEKDRIFTRAGNWSEDIEPLLNRFGAEGWELVQVSPRADWSGKHGSHDATGRTTSEVYFFRRPVP